MNGKELLKRIRAIREAFGNWDEEKEKDLWCRETNIYIYIYVYIYVYIYIYNIYIYIYIHV